MKITVLAAALAACFAVAAQAQAQPAPMCNGELVAIRIDKLKPGATMAQFEAAVHDHIAWYRSHGFQKNTIELGRVIERDPVTGAPHISANEVATIHRGVPGVGPAQIDDGWRAYVGKYQAASDIVTERYLCVAKP